MEEEKVAKTAAKQAEAKQKAMAKARVITMVGKAAASREKAATPGSANVVAETIITSHNVHAYRTG